MTNIRRYFRDNDIVFITSVTHKRRLILIDNFSILWDAIHKQLEKNIIDLRAWVVLPDHFHLLLSAQGINFSDLLRKIKLSFSSSYRKKNHLKSGRIWQYRFWDHIIRDQDDLNKHIDYIHYNPVKHGLTFDPFKWKYSSFRKCFNDGFYTEGWGVKDKLNFGEDFGE